MWEQSKAAKRRFNDGAFHSRYFVGRGLDIGGKPDPLAQYAGIFPRMESVRTWDLEDGDAQLLAGVPDASFDFVHASHSLEHMRDVHEALGNWIRVLRPGGHLIVTVPEEDLYEQGQWPSRFNADHKWTFTMAKPASWSPRSVNAADLAKRYGNRLELERMVLQRDFFREALRARGVDQTLTPVAECAIEIVWRKREQPIFDGVPEGIPDRPLYRPLFSPWLAESGDFARHYELARPRSLVSPDRCWVLWSLARHALGLPGELWECGVYRGGTAAMLAAMVAEADPAGGPRLRLFDTFAGMPATDAARDLHRPGDFADTSLEAVRAAVGHPERVAFHPGEIPGTFAGLEDRAVALAHVDVDIHRSVLECCRFIWPRLLPGGVMVFDDYGFPTCPGARAAVDEFFAGAGAFPLVLPTGQAVAFRPCR